LLKNATGATIIRTAIRGIAAKLFFFVPILPSLLVLKSIPQKWRQF
jgi:hypothetical protein